MTAMTLGLLLAGAAAAPAVHATPLAHAAAASDTAFVPQGVAYRIEAVLDEGAQVVRGRARVRYTNNAAPRLDTLYFHQHLNAFRPNSGWASRELEFGEQRFQRLGPDEHAFERFTRVAVNGRPVTPRYPGSPDSTVVAIPLPQPLARGGSVVVDMDWEARPSTLPRRQARLGRDWHLAQWYPRIAVYDRDGWQHHPLLPQGEFYGEFASYDVTLAVAVDQIIAATGVPVEGDPGWERVTQRDRAPVTLARTAYEPNQAEHLGLLEDAPPEGMRLVRWRAEDVHHFAWAASPTLVYEGGEVGGVPVHILYQAGDADWANGVVLGRAQRALEWLEYLFGAYAWPQLTGVQRYERGGTEFPMLMMNGSASQGINIHEVAHMYVHGMLANNEVREGWLDEGLAEFVTRWFWEAQGGGDTIWLPVMASLIQRERVGATQPVATPGPDFVDFATYQAMTYNKAALVFRMLRDYVGEDAFLRILRTFYDRHKFGHVRGADFERVASEVAGEDLSWFFDQWLRTTARLDYGITDARVERLSRSQYRTTLEITRRGDAWMPVTLRVGDVEKRLEARERTQIVEVVTRSRPNRAILDPGIVLIDYDHANNMRVLR